MPYERRDAQSCCLLFRSNVTNLDDTALFVVMTRAVEVWPLTLFNDGTSKVILFGRLPAGKSESDYMALDEQDNLYVCHASRGRIYAYDQDGDDFSASIIQQVVAPSQTLRSEGWTIAIDSSQFSMPVLSQKRVCQSRTDLCFRITNNLLSEDAVEGTSLMK